MKFLSSTYAKIAFIIAPLAALSIYPLYQTLKYQKPCLVVFNTPTFEQVQRTLEQITHSGQTIKATLTQQLADENNQLLARIPQAFPQIHPTQWENAIKTIQAIKADDDLLCKEPIKIAQINDDFSTLIYATLAEYGINPTRVEIEFVKTPDSFLSACQGIASKNKVRHIIRVNQAQVNKKSREVALAYLRHEIQHLLTYDAIELMIIKDVFEKNNINPEEYYANLDFIELKKFKEYRADLLAATKGIGTTQAFMEDMQERIKLYPHEQENPSHCTHPTEKQRHQVLANLATYMQEEAKQITA